MRMNEDTKALNEILEAMPPWERQNWVNILKERNVLPYFHLDDFEHFMFASPDAIMGNREGLKQQYGWENIFSALSSFPRDEAHLELWEEHYDNMVERKQFSFEDTAMPFVQAHACLYPKLTPVIENHLKKIPGFIWIKGTLDTFMGILGDLYLFFVAAAALPVDDFVGLYAIGGKDKGYRAKNFESFVGCRVLTRTVNVRMTTSSKDGKGPRPSFIQPMQEMTIGVAFTLRTADGKRLYLIREVRCVPMRAAVQLKGLIYPSSEDYYDDPYLSDMDFSDTIKVVYPVSSRLDIDDFTERVYTDPIEFLQAIEDNDFEVETRAKLDLFRWAMTNPRRRRALR